MNIDETAYLLSSVANKARLLRAVGIAASNAGEELRKTFLLMQPLRKQRLPRKLKKRLNKRIEKEKKERSEILLMHQRCISCFVNITI